VKDPTHAGLDVINMVVGIRGSRYTEADCAFAGHLRRRKLPIPHPLGAKFERSLALSDAERSAINAVSVTLENRRAGEGLVRTGDRPSRSFLILSGLLASSKAAMASGEVQITCFHLPGDMPDLHGLHLTTLDSDIRALTDCQLAFMAHRDLRRLCDQHPRLAALLWRTTLVDAAIYREWVVNVGQRPAINRIAHVFCELMIRMEVAGLAQDRSCHLGLTQQHLSEATGLSSVHLNRTLQELRARGLISFGQGTLTIHDWAALVELGDFRADFLHLEPAEAA
jgi:CRP-like cAMP-binding protein